MMATVFAIVLGLCAALKLSFVAFLALVGINSIYSDAAYLSFDFGSIATRETSHHRTDKLGVRLD